MSGRFSLRRSAADEGRDRRAQARKALGDILVADVQGRHEAQHIRPRLQGEQAVLDAAVEDLTGLAGVLGFDMSDITLNASAQSAVMGL